MDDGDRRGDALSLNGSSLAEPLSVAETAPEYRIDALDDRGLAWTRPGRSWLPAGRQAIAVAVVDAHAFTRECVAKSLQECDEALEVAAFASCEDCLAGDRSYDLVLFHAHGAMAGRKGDGGEAQGAPFSKMLGMAPVVVLSAADCPEAVVDAFESGARGYIPTTDTTLDLTVEIVRLVKAGGSFVPPSGLPLRRVPSGTPPAPASGVGEPFTPRQLAVLRHVTQGKANKTIARELAMSESTVKIHLRNIMKKMNASNRTEVACRAQALVADHPAGR